MDRTVPDLFLRTAIGQRNTVNDDWRRQRRDHFPYRMSIPTRWGDNDMLGHVNNVVYYRYFEAIVVGFSIRELGVDWVADAAYPVSIDTRCRFHRQLSFPEVVDAGLRIERLGSSSVTYEIALFGEVDEMPAATGHFIHVYIDRETQRSVPIPDPVRAAIERFA